MRHLMTSWCLSQLNGGKKMKVFTNPLKVAFIGILVSCKALLPMSEKVIIKETETLETPITREYFSSNQPGYDFALKTSDKIDRAKQHQTNFITNNAITDTSSGTSHTRSLEHPTQTSNKKTHTNIIETCTDSRATNKLAPKQTLDISRSRNTHHNWIHDRTTGYYGPPRTIKLNRERYFKASNFNEAYNTIKHFPELQEQIVSTYNNFLEQAAQTLAQDVPQSEIEKCIFKNCQLSNLEKYVWGLEKKTILSASSYDASTSQANTTHTQHLLAKKIFYNQDGSFAGIPQKTENLLFEPIAELQQKLAKIVYNADGTFRGFTCEKDKIEWAYLLRNFAEKNELINVKQFLSSCNQKNLLEFKKIGGWFSKRKLRKQNMQRSAVEKPYLQDYLTCIQAKESNDLNTIKQIVEKYRSRAHKSSAIQKQAQALKDLFETAGGEVDTIHPVDLDRHIKESVTKDQILKQRFHNDYIESIRAMETKDLEKIKLIIRSYQIDTHQSQRTAQYTKKLINIYIRAGGTIEDLNKETSPQTSSSSSTSTNIITSKQSTQMPQELNQGLDWYNSDAARYSMQEYMKQTDRMLANMQDGPAQIAAQHIRDYVTTQCTGLTKEYHLFAQQFAQIISTIKDQHATLTDQALCNFLERVIENTINPQNWDINPIGEWQQGIADIKWRMQKGAELGQSLFGALAKHQQNILPKLDNQQFTQLLKEGKTEQALNLLCQENKMLASIREKVTYNLKNPVSFFGRSARGIIDTGFTLEQAAADVALHNFRSKDEQQAVIDSWTKSYKTFVGNINNASADQVNDLVSSFIADGVTFGIAHKSYANIKANRPSNLIIKPAKPLNNPKIPQLKIGKREMTPANTTIIKAPASFTGKGKTFNHHSKKAPTKNLRLMQQPFPKKLNETSLMQRRNQLPATIRSNQKPRSITPTKIAANSVAKKTSQTKSSKSSSSTNAQVQKVAQNKTTVAEQKGFKPAVEESAKRTGNINKSTINYEAHNAANYDKLKKDLTAQEKASTKSAQKTAKQRVSKEEKARLRDLRAKERKYLNDFNEKQKIVCDKHNIHTKSGIHDLTANQKPKEWHKLVPDDQKHEILAKPFDYTRHTHKHPALPKTLNDNPRPIKINYEHITTPELEIQCKKGIVSGSGFHHDPGNKIEKSGFLKITDRKSLPHGCYQLDWSYTGMREGKPSTLFPAHWSGSKVIEKIYESMDNTKSIKLSEASKGRTLRYVHLGLSKEKIPIISVVEIEQNAARIISAYPDFKKYDEFLKTGKI